MKPSSDWILVETRDVKAIQDQLQDYALRAEPESRSTYFASVHRTASGRFAVTFEPRPGLCDFVNIVGHLFDHPQVSNCAAWITQGSTRYGLEPDTQRLSAHSETAYLIGSSPSGELVEACLFDDPCRVKGTTGHDRRIQEPPVSPDELDLALRIALELGA